MLLNMLLLTLLGTVVAVVAVTVTAVMDTMGMVTAALRLTSPCAVMRRAFSLLFS